MLLAEKERVYKEDVSQDAGNLPCAVHTLWRQESLAKRKLLGFGAELETNYMYM